MGAFDIVKVPGHPGMWARRCVVDAWVAADCPPLDGAGRTKEKQRWFYQQWLNGTGNAADNPDANTRQPHVRGMGLDLAWRNPPADVVERMEEAGFIRPITVRKGKPWSDGKGGFSQDEPWHFELARYYAGVKTIGKVTAAMAAKALPYAAPAGGGASTFDPEEDDMPITNEDAEKIALRVWNQAVKYGTGDVSALQVLADVPKRVWAYPVHRANGDVPAIQELADSKTLGIAAQGQIAALAQLLAVQSAGTGHPMTAAEIADASEVGVRRALAAMTLVPVIAPDEG